MWAVLNSRSARPRPIIERSQRSIVVNRLPKPVRKARWTKNHTSHPGNPLRRSLRTLAMARKRPMVATLPRSRYVNGTAVLALRAVAQIVLAAWRPPCMATSATPGRLFERRHVADREHLGMPGQA